MGSITQDMETIRQLAAEILQPKPYTTIGRSAAECLDILADREFHIRKGE